MRVQPLYLMVFLFSSNVAAMAQNSANLTSNNESSPCQGLFGRGVMAFENATVLAKEILETVQGIREKDSVQWEAKIGDLTSEIGDLKSSVDSAWPKMMGVLIAGYLAGKVIDHTYLFYFVPRLAKQMAAAQARNDRIEMNDL